MKEQSMLVSPARKRKFRRFWLVLLPLLLVACGGKGKSEPTSEARDIGFDRESAVAAASEYDAPADVDEELFENLRSALIKALEARGSADKSPSGAFPLDKANLRYDPEVDELAWFYNNAGDYDLDFSVGVSDITPIAVHYGSAAVYGTLPAWIDGDRNGIVGTGDVTPIALAYGRRITHYEILTSDLPDGGFSVAQTIPAGDWQIFEGMPPEYKVQLPPDAQRYFFVRGVDAEMESPPWKIPESSVLDTWGTEAGGRGDWWKYGADLSNWGSLFKVKPPVGIGLKWVASLGSAITAGPVFACDGTAYVTCGDATLKAIGSSGAQKWSLPLGSVSTTTPAVAKDGTVYVGNNAGEVIAVYPSGREKWRFRMTSESWINSSPAIGMHGTIFIGNGIGEFYSINEDGTLNWMYATEDPASNTDIFTPAIDWSKRKIIVPSSAGKVFCFDHDGHLLWEVQLQAEEPLGSFTLSPPVIALSDEYLLCSSEGMLYRLTGSGKLRDSHFFGLGIPGPMAMDTFGEFVVIGDDYGVVSTIWNEYWDMRQFYAEAPVRTAPVIYGHNHIYFGNSNGTIFAINIFMEELWRYETGAAFQSSPAIRDDGTLYFGNIAGDLYAFDPDAPWDLGDWTLLEVDSGSGVGMANSLALDFNGVPHVVYNDGIIGGPALSKREQTDWTKSAIADTSAIRHLDVAFDGGGNPAIAYFRQSGEFCIARYDGFEWSIESTDVDLKYVKTIQLSFDSGIYPHILYSGTKSGSNKLILGQAAFLGGKWHTTQVEWTYGTVLGAAVGPGGHPHFALLPYHDNDQPISAYHATFINGEWQIGSIYEHYSVQFVYDTKSVEDSLIAFLYLLNNGQPVVVAFDGESWNVYQYPHSYSIRETSHLQFDSSGYPHLIYTIYSRDNEAVRYEFFNGTYWESETIFYGNLSDMQLSFALDDQDKPHVSLCTIGEYGWSTLYYMTK